MPTGRKPIAHCPQLTSTPTVLLAMASAAALGASAVRNIELVTPVVANEFHMM